MAAPERLTGAPRRPRSCQDRLAGLLPADALQDALKGLEPEEITGQGGLLTQLAGRVIDAALAGELSDHLGYPPGQAPPGGAGNMRNGSTGKTVATDLGPVAVNTPRDRQGTFQPKLVGKRQTRLAGLDEKILSLYAGGMSVRDISEHLSSLYGTEIGRDTISRVTDAVLEDIAAWRSRPLETLYPIVYFDALMVKMTEDRSVKTRACYLAVGVTLEGEREILGLWWQDTEGAKFWLAVLNDLHQRGVGDVLIACVDGLAGFPEAIAAVFPQAWVQTCIVHMIRASMRYVSYADRKRLMPDLRRVYSAPNVEEAATPARALRREVGRALSDGRAGMARPVGARHPVPVPTRRSTPRGLHHKRDRGPQPAGPQSDQDPRSLPRRASSNEAHLPRADASRDEMGQSDALALSTTSPQDSLRRQNPLLTTTNHPNLTIAVGTAIAGGPPRRSQRARLTHWAPALGSGVEARVGPGMVDAGLG